MEGRVDRVTRIATVTIVLGLLVLGLKTGAWWLTGSAALFSDALESTVNVAASVIALGALRMAALPADANHPYGHEKAEFFAAVIEGALIMVAAITILQHAWSTWAAPHSIDQPWAGLALNVLATGVNGAWGTRLLTEGRRHRSVALVADARHLHADVVSSLAVVVGLVLAVQTGLGWLDPVLAACVALHVLWSGLKVMRDSVGGLMDAAPADDVVQRIRAVVARDADGAIEAHDLLTRQAGRVTFLEFHLVVPGTMSVADAHVICDRVESSLKSEIPGLSVTIHVEPEGKAKHRGVIVL